MTTSKFYVNTVFLVLVGIIIFLLIVIFRSRIDPGADTFLNEISNPANNVFGVVLLTPDISGKLPVWNVGKGGLLFKQAPCDSSEKTAQPTDPLPEKCTKGLVLGRTNVFTATLARDKGESEDQSYTHIIFRSLDPRSHTVSASCWPGFPCPLQ
jgi:hypothetical protein